jgi:hypothetical protein
MNICLATPLLYQRIRMQCTAWMVLHNVGQYCDMDWFVAWMVTTSADKLKS